MDGIAVQCRMRTAMNDKPQPWHKADENPARKRGGAPLGTHSLTGGGRAPRQYARRPGSEALTRRRRTAPAIAVIAELNSHSK